jgi:fumarate hydratase, class I
MTTIRESDFIQSIADALQFISYYHPRDYIQALGAAYEAEQSPAARDAMAQILYNSRLCAEGRRPICQDTGSVVVFLKVGMDVRWDTQQSLQALVDEGVRRAYLHPDNVLRASIVSPPIGARKNTGDNTPAVVHVELVPGDRVEVRLAAKGGGSENKARFAMLNPSDSVADWVVQTLPSMGAGWCPPGMLGIGIGGSAEKAMLLAKEALLEPIDLHELRARGPANRLEELRLEIFDRSTPSASAPRDWGADHGAGREDPRLSHPCRLPAGGPDPQLRRHPSHRIRAGRPGPGPVRPAAPGGLAGDHLGARGRGPAGGPRPRHPHRDRPMAAGGAAAALRPAAHRPRRRPQAHPGTAGARRAPAGGGGSSHNRFIYYVGPVDPVRDEVVGPAGPTTATRMDRFTEMMLGQTGLIGMVGKGERGPAAIESIQRHGAVYLMAVGGAAYLVAKAIRPPGWSPSRTWAWRRSGSSRWRRCRSPWRWTAAASRSTRPGRLNGAGASGGFR